MKKASNFLTYLLLLSIIGSCTTSKISTGRSQAAVLKYKDVNQSTLDEIVAEADFQLEQMVDMLRATLIKCSIDPKAMEIGEAMQSGKIVKQTVTLKHGLETELCKKIVKIIKEKKMKVQSAIQGDHVRVTGKKRDDLQQVMALLREQDLDQPLQFDNFRD